MKTQTKKECQPTNHNFEAVEVARSEQGGSSPYNNQMQQLGGNVTSPKVNHISHKLFCTKCGKVKPVE